MTTQNIAADLSHESKGNGSRHGPEIRLEHILVPVDFPTTSPSGLAFAAEVAAHAASDC
jgi:hypothetical protein